MVVVDSIVSSVLHVRNCWLGSVASHFSLWIWDLTMGQLPGTHPCRCQPDTPISLSPLPGLENFQMNLECLLIFLPAWQLRWAVQSYWRTFSFVSALMLEISHIIMLWLRTCHYLAWDSCTVFEFPKGSGSWSACAFRMGCPKPPSAFSGVGRGCLLCHCNF